MKQGRQIVEIQPQAESKVLLSGEVKMNLIHPLEARNEAKFVVSACCHLSGLVKSSLYPTEQSRN